MKPAGHTVSCLVKGASSEAVQETLENDLTCSESAYGELDPETLDKNVVYVGILQLVNLYYSIDAQRHYYLHFIVHVDPFTSHVG
jgi:hypothetical protein